MTKLNGIPASAGTVTATACVCVGAEVAKLCPGQVLVAEITTPAMFAMILENASGIVTELGGVTSHPAIIARELGIPCVVGVEGAMSVIQQGATLHLNGNEGIVDVED